MADLIVEADWLITVDPERRVIRNAAVAVIGGRIAGVGTADDIRRDFPDITERVSGRGRVVTPGFVDAHGHAGHALLKALASDSWHGWMPVVTDIYYNHTTEDFWYLDGILSAAERLRAGVTTGVSVIGSKPRATHAEPSLAHARGYAEVGISDVTAVGPSGLPVPHPSRWYSNGDWKESFATLDHMMEVTAQVADELHGARGGLSQVFVTPLTIVQSVFPSGASSPEEARRLTADDREHSKAVRALAKDKGLRIHTDAFGGMVRMAADDPNALLGPDVHVQHLSNLYPEEVTILAETNTPVSHAPVLPAPLPALMAAGLTVAISSDGCAPRRGFDLLDAARSTQLAYEYFERDVYLLPTGKLLEMITIDAAAVLGLQHEIGSIEVGKRADLVSIDIDQPQFQPWIMPVHQLVYRATGSDVRTVIVNGEVLLDGGAPTRIELAEHMREASRVAAETIERAQASQHMTAPGWGQITRRFQ